MGRHAVKPTRNLEWGQGLADLCAFIGQKTSECSKVVHHSSPVGQALGEVWDAWSRLAHAMLDHNAPQEAEALVALVKAGHGLQRTVEASESAKSDKWVLGLSKRANAEADRIVDSMQPDIGILLAPNQEGVRGSPGRKPGYSAEAKTFSINLRLAEPDLTARSRRLRCIKRFGQDSVPEDDKAFREWERYIPVKERHRK